ncbi:MAG TPA: NAD-dependent epimerase/dehydratase family protein [Polyangiaceae bacterium]|nr:NAD-dependent epimerase/dehydratase family protein [Polyangiaceae bacterium]
MKRALVTGGCGFLGSSIVRALLDRNVEVRVLLLPGERTDNVDGLDVELVTGNVLDRSAVEGAVRGMDTVFHAAAIYQAWCPDPTQMYRVNMSGTFNMLEASRRADVARVIYTASVVSLGRPEAGRLATEDTAYDAWDLDFAYSRSKYLSRELAEDFARWGLDVRVVCPGVVLGPGDIGPTPSGKLIINTLKTPTPFYTESGVNYVDVRDAAEVHVLAAEKGAAGERYLATGHNMTTKELMEGTVQAAGKSKRFYRIPVPVARAAVKAFDAKARRTGIEPPVTREFFEYSLKAGYYDNSKTRDALGSSTRPITQTLRDAVNYFRGRGLL